LGSGDHKIPQHVAPIDGKGYAEKRGAAKARLAETKKPTSIDVKEYADKRGVAQARLAGLKKASAGIKTKVNSNCG
jgi:hypothetical protein